MAKDEAYEPHMLRQTFGIPGPLPVAAKAKIGKIVLALAGADGELSEKEKACFYDLQRTHGATSDLVEQWERFDYRRAKVKDLLDADTRPYARAILFEALTVARADGVGPKEHRAAVRMAKELGVDEGLVPAIEGLLELDDAVRGAKWKLFGSLP